MTFPELCRHLQARRVGKGKYMAKCRAHNDQKPSLSVREGRDAALIKCWAGCDLKDVLKASGLSLKDIWYASLEDPAAIRKIRQDREADEAYRDIMREYKRWRLYRQEQWSRMATALAWKLFRNPDSKSLSEAYELALSSCGEALTTWPDSCLEPPKYSPFPSQKLLSGIHSSLTGPKIAKLLKLPS
jgi:hypothetical protein